MIVDCPYCNKKVNIDNSNLEFLNDDNYIEDYECNYCGKEFDVYVEFDPIGSTEKIEYCTCDCCKREDKDKYFYKKGITFPFPKNETFKTLCYKCYTEQLLLEYKNKE